MVDFKIYKTLRDLFVAHGDLALEDLNELDLDLSHIVARASERFFLELALNLHLNHLQGTADDAAQ